MTTTPLSSSSLAANNTSTQQPDTFGRFGRFGGKYVPETLMPALSELEAAFEQSRDAPVA